MDHLEFFVVKPAYSTVLNTKAEVLRHYNNKKDFKILSVGRPGLFGRYVSKSEVQKYNLVLEVRFGKNLEKATIIKLEEFDDDDKKY